MKKKFCILSGAIKNAGDFLITKRSLELLEEVFPEHEKKIFCRNELLDKYIEEFNESEAVIFVGGPMYTKDAYPKDVPFVTDIDNIKTKICEMGLGWWERNYDMSILNDFRFQPKMNELLLRFQRDEGILSARDCLSNYILRNNNIRNVITGCPAWYAPENKQKKIKFKHIKRICISDSVWYKNHNQIIQIVKYIREKFNDAEIVFVFHRGITADSNTCEEVARKNIELRNEIEKMSIKIEDIAYGEQGFSVYDNCDLHIGYRVHAHIYNLSIHNPSILIQEDSRGAGINKTFGLFELNAREEGFYGEENSFLVLELDNLINQYLDEEFYSFISVFEKIRLTKLCMIEHIKNFVDN